MTSFRNHAGWLIVGLAVVASVAVLVKAVIVVTAGGPRQATAALASPPVPVVGKARRRRAPRRHGQRNPTAASDARIVGNYEVVGDIIASYGFSGEQAGDALIRNWLIQRSCIASGCQLTLTRNVAAESGIPPISAVLHPAHGGWTANFTETDACSSTSPSSQTTEFSTWKVWVVRNGLEAYEVGHQPATGDCDAGANTIHWYAKRTDPGGQSGAQPTKPA